VGGGTFQVEVGWEIVDVDGNIVISAAAGDGGAPYDDVTCVEVGCYTLNMTDTYGDGWNGNVMTLSTDYGSWEFTIENGAAGTGEFAIGNPADCGIVFGCMDGNADNYDENATIDFIGGSCEYSCLGATQITIEVAGGNWSTEIYWEILDTDGNVMVLQLLHLH
jgi:hypothetical protein